MPFTAPITPTDPANVARGARNAPAPSSGGTPQGGGMPPLNYYNAGNVTYLYDQNWNHIGQLPNHSMHMAQMAAARPAPTELPIGGGMDPNAPSLMGQRSIGLDDFSPPSQLRGGGFTGGNTPFNSPPFSYPWPAPSSGTSGFQNGYYWGHPTGVPAGLVPGARFGGSGPAIGPGLGGNTGGFYGGAPNSGFQGSPGSIWFDHPSELQ